MQKQGELVILSTQDLSKAIPVTTSLIIAEETERDHRVILQLLTKYNDDISSFGRVAFKMTPFETKGGMQERKIALLNEGQSTFLLTLMRNTPKVIELKKKLIKKFIFMKHELAARIDTRHVVIDTRNIFTDSIDKSIPAGKFKSYAYSNYTKLVYKKVIGMTVKKYKEKNGIDPKGNIRNYFDIPTLEKVHHIESKIAGIIEFNKDSDPKVLYEKIKIFVKELEL